jgi:hypothetical protein
MADTGAWNLSAEADDVNQIVYVNIGPTQGPLVVYRIHNDGPGTVWAGNPQERYGGSGVAIAPGCDCDISGSPINIGLFPREGRGRGGASGTYELVCCQSGPVTVQPPPSGRGGRSGYTG